MLCHFYANSHPIVFLCFIKIEQEKKVIILPHYHPTEAVVARLSVRVHLSRDFWLISSVSPMMSLCFT